MGTSCTSRLVWSSLPYQVTTHLYWCQPSWFPSPGGDGEAGSAPECSGRGGCRKEELLGHPPRLSGTDRLELGEYAIRCFRSVGSLSSRPVGDSPTGPAAARSAVAGPPNPVSASARTSVAGPSAGRTLTGCGPSAPRHREASSPVEPGRTVPGRSPARDSRGLPDRRPEGPSRPQPLK